MKWHTKLFILIELLILFLMINDLITNPISLVLSILGAVSLGSALITRRRKAEGGGTRFIVAWIFLFIGASSTPYFWTFLFIGISYFVVFMGNILPAKSKILTQEVTKKNRRYISILNEEVDKSQSIIGDLEFGKQTYTWDDVNIAHLAGDLYIDLGNTIMPKGENIIVVQQVFGSQKIFIPEGLGVSINVSAWKGQVYFDHQEYSLNNKTFKAKSKNYEDSQRRVNIVINQFIGSTEVVWV